MTTSASARIGSSSRRSLAIELAIPRWSPSGWRWRVSQIAPDEDLVARLEEDDLRPDAAPLERAAHRRREPVVGVAGPDVEHDGDAGEPLGSRRHELGEIGQKLAGQVVDDRIAEVLEELRRRCLATARQAADDRRPRARSRLDRTDAVGPRPRRSPAAAPDERWTVSSKSMYMRDAEHERADEVTARRCDRGEDRDRRGSIIRRDGRSRVGGHDPDPRQTDEHDRELHDAARKPGTAS